MRPRTDHGCRGAERRLRLTGLRAFRFDVDGDAFAVFELPLERTTHLEYMAALTRAEREVSLLLLEGRANAQIAVLRGTSVHTVANQVASIFRKLGVGSRLELCALASRDSSRSSER